MAASSLLAEIRASSKPFYIYILRKPDGTPFYVGLGRGRRVFRHEWNAKKTDKQTHLLNTIRKIWRDGGDIAKQIESFHETLELASNREIELIAEIGRDDLGTGPLVNQTSGGNFTWKLGPQGKRAASRLTSSQFKDPQRRAKQSAALKRYFADPDARAIASAAGKAMMTPDVRAKIGNSRRKFNLENPILAKANDAARLLALRSPQVQQKNSERGKLRVEHQRVMVRASLMPTAKENHARAQRARFAKPEERAKASAAAASWRADRTAIIRRCQALLTSLGLVPPSGHDSIADWLKFEERLLTLVKE